MRSLVTSIFPYACDSESWTLTAEPQRRMRAMEMSTCYCKTLRISYKDHVTNEEVCANIQQAIRPHDDLSIVTRRTLKWYELVSCSLGQTIFQGTVKGGGGGRRQGGQKKRWEDNIKEWTCLRFAKSQMVVDNR